MKKVDCEFHYYHPELIKYLTGQHTAPRYFPETKVLELREGAASKFSTVTNTYLLIDELTDFGERRVAEMDKNGIDGILFGRDYPYENLKVMTDTWNEIASELTEEEREKFWHGNAERYGLV